MWGKVLKDNVKTCIPFKQTLRAAFRKVAPYRSLPANDAYAFEQGLDLLRFLRRYDVALKAVLEVGTGWIPTLPHMLRAAGAERIILTDIERLGDEATWKHAETFVASALGRLAEASGLDEASLWTNLARSDVEEYRVPPRLAALPEGSIDLVYSRTVLEHIPPDLLRTQLEEWRRLLRPGGCCIHFIDNSDHFEHMEERLSRLNFLSVPDWAWKIACFNPQNYQNRLRHSDYIGLFRNAGYELVHVEGEIDQQALADLRKMKLNKRFSLYKDDDLATLTSVIVARKPASDTAQSV